VADQPVFSASEVEKFDYCPLSWWLAREVGEEDTEDMDVGVEKHEEVARHVSEIRSNERRAEESETVVLYFAIAATVISVLGITFFQNLMRDIGQIMGVLALIWLLSAVYFLYKAETLATQEERFLAERIMLWFAIVATLLAVYMVAFITIEDVPLSRVLQVAALVWLVGASFFLHRALVNQEAATAAREAHGVAEGDITYIDSKREKPKLFASDKWGLRGRPDYVVLVDDEHIPVEVKTGRTPRGPLFSHILQLAAYCLLLEEEYGTPPPYGLLRYENAQHEVEYNEDLKHLLLGKMEEMRTALLKGEAHRNHNRLGKCEHCSRRAVCPERLT
jgi:CRISPR-associated exonuclease Cas4